MYVQCQNTSAAETALKSAKMDTNLILFEGYAADQLYQYTNESTQTFLLERILRKYTIILNHIWLDCGFI